MRVGKTVWALVFSLLLGCGAATSRSETTAQATTNEWTAAQLQKLDPELRERVRTPRGRVAISVSFLELPSEDELSELLLNRVGERFVGNVEVDTLQRIAAHPGVERIEPLEDVGYDML